MNRPRIFVSAVSDEFGTARRVVAATLYTLGYDPVSQDNFPTGQGELRQWLRDQIDDCEGLIQLVGQGYGAEPSEADNKYGRVSYTQFEFRYAMERKKKTWVIFPEEQCKRDNPVEKLDLPRGAIHSEPPDDYQAKRRQLQHGYIAWIRSENHIRCTARTDSELELLVHKLKDELKALREDTGILLKDDADFKAKTSSDLADIKSELADAVRLMTQITASLLELTKAKHDSTIAEARRIPDPRIRESRIQAAENEQTETVARIKALTDVDRSDDAKRLIHEVARITEDQGEKQAMAYVFAKFNLPLVVQLGFAGSRFLFDATLHPNIDASWFSSVVQMHITGRLMQLPTELRLTDRFFICGLSQLAIGADTIFTRALAELNWPQRVLLPQLREDFLAAAGKAGNPDVSVDQRATARNLFASDHVIQEIVVGESSDLHTRYHEANIELARESDIILCLLRADEIVRPGESLDLLTMAQHQGIPLLSIRVSVGANGEPILVEEWSNLDRFSPPELPVQIRKLVSNLSQIPSMSDYCRELLQFGRYQARWRRNLFQSSAIGVISTHILATVGAVTALILHEHFVPTIVLAEVGLLLLGLGTHLYLHSSKSVLEWAMARLVAEIARSGIAMRLVSAQTRYMLNLSLPTTLRHLLRTISVLHLRESRQLTEDSWEVRRNQYVAVRLDPMIVFFGRKQNVARAQLKLANHTFLIGSIGAIAAAITRLLLVVQFGRLFPDQRVVLESLMGGLAVVLPVAAVAGLSLASSLNLEAIVQTYKKMHDFLRRQRDLMETAVSEPAFDRLAMETESSLLGEVANWYARTAHEGSL